MRTEFPEIVRAGLLMGSLDGGCNGAFRLRTPAGQTLRVVASDGAGWEHVSVSLQDRTPTWKEMCWVKDLFWKPGETVVQYHPAERDYVNFHPHCLHLWRPTEAAMPTPPPILVGPVTGRRLAEATA